ncbi:ML domain-containing protein [Ceratobasidium theobromae]|uniref:Phosphatidylglycerol/phosphatidylinositol transfer protein n=1 Tax=Ceratobasidium theobromae TaxID=1582974 RepID=A0A5N5QLJ8_9AGAM|nr:ML domain-containing protein [Ceratobasidium theobromae]
MTQSELYKVILRGETFSLDRSQVEFDSPNYFTSCFLGSFSESHRQEIQLSRDPALFSMIVTYLSGYTILPLKPASGMSEEATLENLLRDALFYGLDDLVKMLEEYRAGDKQPRSAEEKVVKSYVMILWPHGMCNRRGQFAIRLSESQAQAQCSAHPISPNSVSMLQSPGAAIVKQALKEQKIVAHSWSWAAFWTTLKPTNYNAPGTRIENEYYAVPVYNAFLFTCTPFPALVADQVSQSGAAIEHVPAPNNCPYLGASVVLPPTTIMLPRAPFALLATALVAQVAALPSFRSMMNQFRFSGGEAHTTSSWSYTDCGLPTDAVEVKSIKISPDPPQIGKDLTVTAQGVDGAYADVTVKLGRVKLLHKEFDICEEARNNNVTIQCPVEPGEYEIVQTVQLPKETPRAKFTVDVEGYTSEEAWEPDLVCLKLQVDFIKRPWLSL